MIIISRPFLSSTRTVPPVLLWSRCAQAVQGAGSHVDIVHTHIILPPTVLLAPTVPAADTGEVNVAAGVTRELFDAETVEQNMRVKSLRGVVNLKPVTVGFDMDTPPVLPS